MLNIIIPMYNESERIPETLMKLSTYLKNKTDIKVYLVDDGSTDNTSIVAKRLIKELNIDGELISYAKNKGKGFAVKMGMLQSSKADYYYFADADSSANWDQLDKLLEIAKTKNLDCVIGSRAMQDSNASIEGKRLVSGRFSNFLIKNILGLPYLDTQCGYKLFGHSCIEAFKLQRLDRFGFDFEILYILKLLKLEVAEVGIAWESRPGSKVGLKDYYRTLKELVKVKFNSYLP